MLGDGGFDEGGGEAVEVEDEIFGAGVGVEKEGVNGADLWGLGQEENVQGERGGGRGYAQAFEGDGVLARFLEEEFGDVVGYHACEVGQTGPWEWR